MMKQGGRQKGRMPPSRRRAVAMAVGLLVANTLGPSCGGDGGDKGESQPQAVPRRLGSPGARVERLGPTFLAYEFPLTGGIRQRDS
jgi:hypothetical protein